MDHGVLRLVSTDPQATMLGTISLDEAGAVTYTGAGGGLLVALRRKMRHATDAEVFHALATSGWTNGYARLVRA